MTETRPTFDPALSEQDHASQTVAYTFLYEDFAALTKAAALNGPSRGVIWLGMLVLWAAVFLITVVGTEMWLDGWKLPRILLDADLRWDLLKTLPFLIILGVLIGLPLQRMYVRQVFKKRAVANQEVALSIDAQGIRSTVAGLEGKASWTTIKYIYSSKDYLILFASKSEGIVIPHRSLPSTESFDSIVSFAKERVNGQTL